MEVFGITVPGILGAVLEYRAGLLRAGVPVEEAIALTIAFQRDLMLTHAMRHHMSEQARLQWEREHPWLVRDDASRAGEEDQE